MDASRYSRQMQLPDFGIQEQQQLFRSSVLVIGAGGLGCPVLQILVSAGVGTMGIADFDTVALHNLHRQFLYDEQDIGKPKVIAAKEQLEKSNSQTEIQIFHEMITAGNALAIVQNFDVVVDCTDNFSTRYLINDICFLLKKPLVYGSVFRYEGQVAVFSLEKEGQITGYRDLFPVAPEPHEVPDCNEAGVLPPLTSVIGSFQAYEVIKILTASDDILVNRVLLFNLKNYQATVIKFKSVSDKACPKSLEEIRNFDYQVFCGADKSEEIHSLEELSRFLQQDNSVLVDVREPDENPEIPLKHVLKVPVSAIEQVMEGMQDFEHICFICASGVRSKKVLTQCKLQYPDKELKHIPKGITIFQK